MRSEDFFSNSVTISDDINAFAIYEQYLVVADIAKDARDKMVLRASIDGFKFVNVELPPKVDASNK